MNKTIPYIIILLIFSLSSMGQSYVGVFAGFNSSKLSGDAPPKASYKSLMGANVGAHFDIKLGKITALSLQPSFSQEGSRVFYSVPNEDEMVDSLSLRLNYISLPLLLRVTSTNERFYAIGGVEAGYLMSSSLKSQKVEQEMDLTISDFNVAVHFGAGFRIPLGYPRLFIELRYSQGLINLTDDPLANNIIPRVKTNGFKAFVGIEIPLKKSKN